MIRWMELAYWEYGSMHTHSQRANTMHAHRQHIFGWHYCCLIVCVRASVCIVEQTILRFHLGCFIVYFDFEMIRSNWNGWYAWIRRGSPKLFLLLLFLLNYVEQYKYKMYVHCTMEQNGAQIFQLHNANCNWYIYLWREWNGKTSEWME